ncbi:MAG: type III-B CRISPR module-associated Cmr3 family protein, partial [Thermoplasmata archaeon]
MVYFKINPLDTMFFRDGISYNMGETQTNVESMFPPSPSTVVGAIRARIAMNLGWSGKGEWNQDISEVIGSGNHIGKLIFDGPFVGYKNEMIFPIPMNVLGSKKEENKYEINVIMPGKEILSDMGEIKYPAMVANTGVKVIENSYITASTLQKLLEGTNNHHIDTIHFDEVFKKEPSVGIKRDEVKLTVKEGNLFSRIFVRMEKDSYLIMKLECNGC